MTKRGLGSVHIKPPSGKSADDRPTSLREPAPFVPKKVADPHIKPTSGRSIGKQPISIEDRPSPLLEHAPVVLKKAAEPHIKPPSGRLIGKQTISVDERPASLRAPAPVVPKKAADPHIKPPSGRLIGKQTISADERPASLRAPAPVVPKRAPDPHIRPPSARLVGKPKSHQEQGSASSDSFVRKKLSEARTNPPPSRLPGKSSIPLEHPASCDMLNERQGNAHAESSASLNENVPVTSRNAAETRFKPSNDSVVPPASSQPRPASTDRKNRSNGVQIRPGSASRAHTARQTWTKFSKSCFYWPLSHRNPILEMDDPFAATETIRTLRAARRRLDCPGTPRHMEFLKNVASLLPGDLATIPQGVGSSEILSKATFPVCPDQCATNRLGYEELKGALVKAGFGYFDEHQIRCIFSEIDEDSKGFVTAEEFDSRLLQVLEVLGIQTKKPNNNGDSNNAPIQRSPVAKERPLSAPSPHITKDVHNSPAVRVVSRELLRRGGFAELLKGPKGLESPVPYTFSKTSFLHFVRKKLWISIAILSKAEVLSIFDSVDVGGKGALTLTDLNRLAIPHTTSVMQLASGEMRSGFAQHKSYRLSTAKYDVTIPVHSWRTRITKRTQEIKRLFDRQQYSESPRLASHELQNLEANNEQATSRKFSQFLEKLHSVNHYKIGFT